MPDPEYTQALVESDILYLKQTPYTKDTEDEIKLKLKRTVKHRQLLLTDANSNMLANFPYLFVHSELVISFFLIVCSYAIILIACKCEFYLCLSDFN